jgi:hypothetical protein
MKIPPTGSPLEALLVLNANMRLLVRSYDVGCRILISICVLVLECATNGTFQLSL